MDDRLEDRVDRLLRASQATEDQDALLEAAIEAAKPAAFAVFEEKAAEAANLLRTRKVSPETTKDVVLRFESKKKFLSSQIVQLPVPGPRISGWILSRTLRSTDRGNAVYNLDPSWYGGMVMDEAGKLYSFKDDTAFPVTTFDQAVSAIGSSAPRSVDRVAEMASFWEDKVVQTTARAILGEPCP